MWGTKTSESDGRFLEELDGIEYDGLFIFEENAYLSTDYSAQDVFVYRKKPGPIPIHPRE